MKLASRSFGDPYQCQKDWPEDCYVQCGGRGLVLVRNPAPDTPSSYRTAFFEAFPNDPKTFIRGEGETVEAAEASAWAKLQRYQACTHAEFERRKHRNGYGFCTQCGMGKSGAFLPLEKCIICGEPTYYAQDMTDAKTGWYCEDHADQRPKTDWELEDEEFLRKMDEIDPEDFKASLKGVIDALAKPSE